MFTGAKRQAKLWHLQVLGNPICCAYWRLDCYLWGQLQAGRMAWVGIRSTKAIAMAFPLMHGSHIPAHCCHSSSMLPCN